MRYIAFFNMYRIFVSFLFQLPAAVEHMASKYYSFHVVRIITRWRPYDVKHDFQPSPAEKAQLQASVSVPTLKSKDEQH